MGKKVQLDADAVSALSSQNIDDARVNAVGMIEALTFKNVAAKARIIQDIINARRPAQICATMFNVILAGDGLSVMNSQWQKQYA